MARGGDRETRGRRKRDLVSLRPISPVQISAMVKTIDHCDLCCVVLYCASDVHDYVLQTTPNSTIHQQNNNTSPQLQYQRTHLFPFVRLPIGFQLCELSVVDLVVSLEIQIQLVRDEGGQDRRRLCDGHPQGL